MSNNLVADLWESITQTSSTELLAAAAGIVSVWFSKKASSWVYPTGLLNTIIYVWLSFKIQLPGEGVVNLYYTIMSLYGWYNWSRKDLTEKPLVQISYATSQEWIQHVLFFVIIYIVLYGSLSGLKEYFFEGAIPWADALASAAAFTGMWLMTQKKIESWYWWIVTNITSMPLYFVKGLRVTALYYLILLLLAFAGLHSWKEKVKKPHA
ncbi:MAG: nicotinamide mononucleotide transporter [Bacteroidetes bacterium]|nr:nicotinamide mononucleotide transporter [Bacteroidota bacterium]